MYERNAIVFERYFDKLFDYNAESNLKVNYENYVDLVNSLEKYLESTDAEDKIMVEYEEIVNIIKNLQKEENVLYNKSIKLQNDRNNLFSEIGENAEDISNKLLALDKEIEENENLLKNVGKKFIESLREFNEKIEVRTQIEKENRIIDMAYNKSLDRAIDLFGKLNMDKVKFSRSFFEQDTTNISKEITEKVLKNGAKERVKFDENVINKAIQIDIDINKREIECYNNAFDKIGKLFAEIKDDNVKISKHKKTIKDMSAKLEFLNAEKDYVILFLDNERLNIMSGEKEHHKLMQEACKYLEKDLEQIRNLYELLLKEIAGKATKKLIKELYNTEYLYELENEQKEFELKVSKFNLVGTVINPDYWRMDGIRKIYDVFRNIMKDTFETDLSQYEYKAPEVIQVLESEKEEKEIVNEKVNNVKQEEVQENIEVKPIEEIKQDEKENEDEIRKRKLDKILAFINNDVPIEDEENEIESDKKDSKKNNEAKVEDKKVAEEKNIDKQIIEEDDDVVEDSEDDFDSDFGDDFDEDFEDEIDLDFGDFDLDEMDDEDEKPKALSKKEDINKEDDILVGDNELLDYEDDFGDDFDDEMDFDFDDDEDEKIIEEDDSENESLKKKKTETKSKSKKEKNKKDAKEKSEQKTKTRSKGKQIANKIKQMAQSEKDIKNMWAE